MAIVPIINIKDDDREQVKQLFASSLYFSGFEGCIKFLMAVNKT